VGRGSVPQRARRDHERWGLGECQAAWRFGVDVREFVEPAYWDRINAARARAASSGRALRGPAHQEQYVGPMRKGWRLGPSAAEDLAELLALAVVKAESITVD
jgi:hypothetical protein